ncbi:MAG TPA: twin-arginine translocation signal domain-containing protein, partial [Verrucomicrobiae bacterium]|nr:twin-arginine translocation signal domain-containing protein [Verrucomicrobiae bacterium]
MSFEISRRKFLAGLGTATAATATSSVPALALFEPPLYPPIDLSYFDTPIGPAPAELLFGYAAITWGG